MAFTGAGRHRVSLLKNEAAERRSAIADAMKDKHCTYQPRIVRGQVMMPADLKRLHKYMREVEHIDIVF